MTLRRHFLWAAAVVVAMAVFLFVAGRDGYRDVLTDSPVQTREVAVGEAINWDGIQLTVRQPQFTDSESLDARGVDDDTQQLLVVDVSFNPDEPGEEFYACTARVEATVAGITAEHNPRFSLSEYRCDAMDTAIQRSRFVFVLPRGEVSEATVFLNFGQRTTWLRTTVV